jgi:hypothetical protein
MFYKYFKDRGAFLLCNYTLGAVKFSCFDSKHSVNLNTLLYRDFTPKPKKHDFIYYGTFREDRKKYFKKYLNKPVIVSTSSKNMKKYRHHGCDPYFTNKINWRAPILSMFRYSLYIEDEFTHNNFNNLANRFYESVGAKAIVLFDESCINTLEKSEIENYQDHIVSDHKELLSFDKRKYKTMLKNQADWRQSIIELAEETADIIESVLRVECK